MEVSITPSATPLLNRDCGNLSFATVVRGFFFRAKAIARNGPSMFRFLPTDAAEPSCKIRRVTSSELTRSLFAAMIALPVMAAVAESASTERPNIVLILADDLGIGDTKCYGGSRCRIETPNIDALSRGGLRFTDAHVNASVCGPTRAAIMTGRYPWRFGKAAPGGAWGFIGTRFPSETFTLADLLRVAGYRTGYVGKWHLGTQMTTTDGKVQNKANVDYEKPLKVGPPQYGFDESFILPGSLDMYPYAYVRNNVWQGEVTAQKGWSAFNRVGPAEKNFEDHEVLETLYRESEAFISQQQSGTPFFLYLALTAPHTPISPGIAWQNKSDLGLYGDFVMEVDHAVKRVVDRLKEAGVYENTLILFSSDHGAASYAGNIRKATPGQVHRLEDTGHYPSGPHRGYKFSVYEGGLRVPLIAHWPAVIQAGTTSDAIVGLCDLMATFAEVCGGKLSSANGPDSISFANLLRDPSSPPGRQNLVLQSALGCFAIRDGNWKLCLCPGSGARGTYGNTPSQDEAWRNAMNGVKGEISVADTLRAPFVQLFDLSQDPHEDHNLAAKHPERIASMVAKLNAQIENGRSTQGPKLGNDTKVSTLRVPGWIRERLRSN